MTTIKSTTARGQALLDRAYTYEGYTLHEVYGSFSYAKAQAYKHCLDMCCAENGRNYHICSHNTFGFSVAWVTDEGVRIETSQSSYLIV